jgi:hypothetical protein
MIKARAVPVPSDGVLAPLYVGADLLDAFAIHLRAGASDDLEVLARVAFERQAAWVLALTWVRDTVMATVGVKSSRAIAAAAASRGLQVIGYLPLLSKSAGELVMGGDDRHLDFRVAVLLHTGAPGGRELVVVTVVHCHNRLGRTCLAVIAPFHRTILRAYLERAVPHSKILIHRYFSAPSKISGVAPQAARVGPLARTGVWNDPIADDQLAALV